MPQQRFRVLILGHGEMGQALEQLLGARHAVTAWERRPRAGAAAIDLAAAATESDFVLFCLPANPHFELAARLAPVLGHGCICLSIAKGLDDSGRTAAQVFAAAFAQRVPYALLYGPMISEEIRAGRPAFAECGCTDDATRDRVGRLFQGAPLALRHTSDITGISWSAVLKNVYAMLFGVLDELAFGDNTRGYLTAAALAELDRLVVELGGLPGTPYGLAGLGDLVTTATSAGSHHHELGRRLARGQPAGLQGEGLHTLAMVRRHRFFDPGRYPLYFLIDRIAADPANARAAVQEHLGKLFEAGAADLI